MIHLFTFTFSLILGAWGVFAHPKEIDSSKVEYHNGQKILVGSITAAEIWDQIAEWKAEYVLYQPDSGAVESLSEIDQKYQIVCILGIWCSDSRNAVPGFLKAFEMADNPQLKIELIGVDREKIDPDGLAEKYEVNRVPTFIIFYQNREIGRMVEFPVNTFEADFIALIKNDKIEND